MTDKAELPRLPKSAPHFQLPSLTVSPGQALQFILMLNLPPNTKLTEEAPSSWFFTAEGKRVHVPVYRRYMLSLCFSVTQIH